MPPLKLAIIGGGPSGFYVASRLRHLLPKTEFGVHIYDRLWAPYGLVRYGVAPDHPEVKNCTHKFDETASDPRIQFFGNVEVSAQPNLASSSVPLHLQELFPYYTHLLFATGGPLPRLHPQLARSKYCIPALDLVHWYTMHPRSPYNRPASPIPECIKNITIIGHGNVSLDVARLLLTSPKTLAPLDIPGHVIESLEGLWDTLRHLSIVGRRGPSDVRFTAKEVREMMSLTDAGMIPIPDEIVRNAEKDPGDADNGGLSRQQSRILKLLKQGSQKVGSNANKSFSIDFWRSPVGYEVAPPSSGSRVSLKLEETKLDGGRLVGTGRFEKLETDLIVTSLGYESDPSLFGSDTPGSDTFPWYEKSKGHIRTASAGGRVLSPEGHIIPNVYASGWAGRGARGVLAGTLMDANDVAAAIVQDWKGKGVPTVKESVETDLVGSATFGGAFTDLKPLAKDVPMGWLDVPPPAVKTGVYDGRVVTFEAWRRLQEEECKRGGGVKERERLTWDEVRHILKSIVN